MKSEMNVDILDCTLRDGSYAIDYQFTTEDTAIISAGLEQAGVRLIEIGHGLGLNASSPKIGIAAATDEEYLEVASSVLKKAKFGMFFIPGIGRMEDLDLAAKYGMGFVRIGTNVTEIENAEPFIKRAKELSMMVSSNLMKSYAVSLEEFVKKVKLADEYGADVICVVDSAGGMIPEDVKRYIQVVKNETDALTGFHGHNNLLLAVANSIEAIKSGANIIDASLQGMGRSAGNAQTEIMVILLEKMGYTTGIDLRKMMDLGEKIVRPIMGGEKGIDSITATLGYAQFHSSFMKIIYTVSQKYNIDPRELVIKVSEKDKVNVTEELAEEIALSIKTEERTGQTFWNINIDSKEFIKKHKEENSEEIAKDIAKHILSLSKKTGKPTVFTIAGSYNLNKRGVSFPFIRQNAVYIIGNAEVSNPEEGIRIAQAVDGLVDYILVDADSHTETLKGMAGRIKNVVKKGNVYTYKDSDALVSAVDTLVSQLVDESHKRIAIIGENNRAKKLSLRLKERGFEVNPPSDRSVGVLIGVSPFQPAVDIKALKRLESKGIIIDAGPESIFPEVIDESFRLKIPIYRVDMRAGLSGEIINVLETHQLKDRIMGKGEIADIPVVAGGVLGRRGDIVLDSISNPTMVIGVADGKGGLLKESEISPFIDRIKKVRLEIAIRRFL